MMTEITSMKNKIEDTTNAIKLNKISKNTNNQEFTDSLCILT